MVSGVGPFSPSSLACVRHLSRKACVSCAQAGVTVADISPPANRPAIRIPFISSLQHRLLQRTGEKYNADWAVNPPAQAVRPPRLLTPPRPVASAPGAAPHPNP